LTDLPQAEQAEIAAGGKKEAAARAKRRREQKAGGRRNTGRTEGTTTVAGRAGSEASTDKSRSVGAPAPFELGQVLPPQVRAELRLTEKQQKEVAKLEKEVKARLHQILNKEQKKQIVAMRTPGRPEPEGGACRDRSRAGPRSPRRR
jgi:hypothetical protein